MAILLREVIGDVLRQARTTQGRTLREVSHSARVSLGYLSEVERGRKEASSELLNAICTALDVPLSRVLADAGAEMACHEDVAARKQTEPLCEIKSIGHSWLFRSNPPRARCDLDDSLRRETRILERLGVHRSARRLEVHVPWVPNRTQGPEQLDPLNSIAVDKRRVVIPPLSSLLRAARNALRNSDPVCPSNRSTSCSSRPNILMVLNPVSIWTRLWLSLAW